MRQRALDWFLGALGMLVLLLIAALIAWWSITEPAPDDVRPLPRPTPTVTGPGTVQPPTDLGSEEIWIGEMDLSSGLVMLPDSTLYDIDATGHGARSGPDGLTVAYLEVDATVPFAEVARNLEGNATLRSASAGQVAMETAFEFWGRQLPIVATGTVDVVGGKLSVVPTKIDLGLPDSISRALADLVDSLVTIEHEVTGLPENLELLDVTVLDDGFRASLAGRNVVLAEGAPR